jgi:arginine repressor
MLLECVGSVAGDDTIIIVLRTAGEASDYCATLLTLAELRRTT